MGRLTVALREPRAKALGAVLDDMWDMEQTADKTSLLAGTRNDAYLQPDGYAVVRYASNPKIRGHPTSLDRVLPDMDPREVAAFRDVTQRLASRGPLRHRDAEIGILEDRVFADVDPGFAQAAEIAPESKVGVVRVMCPSVSRMIESQADDVDNLDTVMDAKYLLVDGMDRPRRLSEDALEDVRDRVHAKALAYYAVLLARHARTVRSARASANMCVEGNEDCHDSVSVPSRIWI
jgi:hypothetical protein